MTMFNWQSNQPAAPPPFTKERWADVLQSLEINFGVDTDGDRFGDWEVMRMWFLVEGEKDDLMAIRSMWDVRPPVEAYDFLVEALNTWNRDHFWPKASVTRGEDHLGVFGDLVIDVETGVTDDFLRQQVRCMIGTSAQLYEYLAGAFPESKDWFNAGVEESPTD
jgi:Putative bacterial sensory transduction regulator